VPPHDHLRVKCLAPKTDLEEVNVYSNPTRDSRMLKATKTLGRWSITHEE